MTNTNREEPATIGGAAADTGSEDHGGLDRNFDQVDIEAANDIGSDPPGGLGTDIGGGSGELGTSDQADATGSGTLEQE